MDRVLAHLSVCSVLNLIPQGPDVIVRPPTMKAERWQINHLPGNAASDSPQISNKSKPGRHTAETSRADDAPIARRWAIMGIRTIISGGFKKRLPVHSPRGEADRLLGIWGDTAYDIARSLSVREDAGLLQTASPGFWASVVREIGHQMGIPESPVLGSHHFVI